jgi:excisionase family DNA binding protein
MSTPTGTLTAALVLDGVRAMCAAERNELRALLDLDRPTAADPGRWMDSRAAADYLGVHRDTLRKLAAAGVLPSEQDGPACKRYFNKAALDRWRESGGRFHAASIPPKTGTHAGDSR